MPAHALQGKEPNKQKMSTALPISTPISVEAQKKVSEQLRYDYSQSPVADLQLRYKLLDLAYAMENDESLKQTNASRIITTLYKEHELPILQPNIDHAHAYFTGIFTSGYPIFGVVSEDHNRSKVAKEIEAIIAENSKNSGWARQMNLWLKQALKYNIAAIECDWYVRKTFEFSTDTTQSFEEAVSSTVARQGNEMKSYDMYNTHFDSSVAPADIHTKGDYVINVELLTLTQLHELIGDLRSNNGVIMNEDKNLWMSSPMHNWYYHPHILNQDTISYDTDWSKFFTFGANPLSERNGGVNKYEVVTYFRRIIPSMLGINQVPDKDSVQIWKFIEVNGIVIYCERKTNVHRMLPVVFIQPYEDNLRLQTKGLGDNLRPFQKLAGTMWRARLASLARALSDRALYDPARVSEKHVNAVVPTAKIPVKPGAYGSKLSEAYYPIPYDDRNGQMLHQDIGQVMGWSEEAAKINKAQRGQFVRGNKTLGEWNDVMDSAEGPQQAQAMLIEEQGMVPLKYLIKVNILQYQPATTLVDPVENKPVEIDPVEIRKSIINFKLADGLLPKDKLLNWPQTIEAFQVLAQIEGANQEYDLVGMIASSMEQRGAKLMQHRREQRVDFNQPQGQEQQQVSPNQQPVVEQ